jgi:uncharacterized protein (TIGR03435 family)
VQGSNNQSSLKEAGDDPMRNRGACQWRFVVKAGFVRSALCLGLLFPASAFLLRAAEAQPAFGVASIRPSAAEVPFEHDGKRETSPGTLRMQDVTVVTCIKWAYGVQDSQIVGPTSLRAEHYDIIAKADEPVGDDQLKLMMRTLLAERFKLSFHHENKELRSYALIVAKKGQKLRESVGEGKSTIQNSAIGMVAKSTTMQEFANFIAEPLRTPVVNKTGLDGRYDFAIDFTNYLPADASTVRPDVISVMMAALEGELGLKLESTKTSVETMVVDHVEKPSAN